MIQNTTFTNLMRKLNIQPAQSNTERFNEWMKKKVKSIHYADNNAMCKAYERIV